MGIRGRPGATLPALAAPSGEGVVAWLGFFAAGRSFKSYVAPQEKAWIFLGWNAASKTKAVPSAGHGLANFRGETFSPRRSDAKDQLARIAMARRWSDEFTLICLIGWTFLLRVLSECLPFARQRAAEGLASDDRLGSEAVIRLAERQLVAKLNKKVAGFQYQNGAGVFL